MIFLFFPFSTFFMNCSSETTGSKWSFNFIIEMLSLARHNYNKKAANHFLAATFLCQLNTTSGIREDREEESAFRSGKNPWYEIICQGQYLFDGKLYFMHYSGIFQFCISPVLNNGTIDLFIFRCKENLITPRSWEK